MARASPSSIAFSVADSSLHSLYRHHMVEDVQNASICAPLFPCHLHDCTMTAVPYELLQNNALCLLIPAKVVQWGNAGHRAVEETSNDVNNLLLKGSTKKEISGMHDVRSHHYATLLG